MTPAPPAPSLDALLRYFQVRPVDIDSCPEEWDAWIQGVLDDSARAELARGLDLPPDEPLHPGCYEGLDDAWKTRFSDWLEEINWDWIARVEWPHEAPAWTLLDSLDRPVRPATRRWLHFTDAPDAIAREGFRYGVADPDRLALTRLNDAFGGCVRVTPEGPGYNFAYPIDGSIDLDRRVDGYGRHAVLLTAPALLLRHLGDRETQAVFAGPNARDIVPLTRDGHAWTAPRGARNATLAGLVRHIGGASSRAA